MSNEDTQENVNVRHRNRLIDSTKDEDQSGDHCISQQSDFLSGDTSSSKNIKNYMALRRQTVSESSNDSLSNQTALIGNHSEYIKNSLNKSTMRSSDLQRQTSISQMNTGASVEINQKCSRSMVFNLLLEVVVRLMLLYGTAKFEKTAPFKRIIHPEEVWLYKNPMTKDYVPASTALLWIMLAPLVLIISSYLLTRNRKDFIQAICAFTLTIAINGFLTSLIKVSVGRPRPDFFYRCFPNGVMGESFEQCTGDPQVVEEGRKSFPSGHSSMSFSGFGFMSFYLTSKLHVFNERGRGQAWRLCIALAPLIVATEVAISRTCDYHHHWQDVIAGSLLGIFVSYLSYRQYFPSIFARNCHRAYSSSGRSMSNQVNCFVPNTKEREGTDENQPLIASDKDNKWI